LLECQHNKKATKRKTWIFLVWAFHTWRSGMSNCWHTFLASR
jgi:hypothetical protein